MGGLCSRHAGGEDVAARPGAAVAAAAAKPAHSMSSVTAGKGAPAAKTHRRESERRGLR